LVNELIARGKQRGFVTEDEIIHILPEVEKDIEDLENLYEKLEMIGVKIVSSDEGMIQIDMEKRRMNMKRARKNPTVSV